MGDILYSIDADKMAALNVADENTQGKSSSKKSKQETAATVSTVNTTKLRKQMKSLKKEVEKAPALDKPQSGRKRKIQE